MVTEVKAVPAALGQRVLPVLPEPILVEAGIEVIPGQDLVGAALAALIGGIGLLAVAGLMRERQRAGTIGQASVAPVPSMLSMPSSSNAEARNRFSAWSSPRWPWLRQVRA